MSVILEFTVGSEQFTLGEVLSGPPDVDVDLERIVPTGESVMPFLWVRGADFEAFEAKVLDHPSVADLAALDRVGDSTLYRITWHGEHIQLIDGITRAQGTVLEATGGDDWHFRLRFADHDALSQFYNYCTDYGIRVHIDRSYTLAERGGAVDRFGLTEEQREALVLGLRRGYFDTPSEVTLEELATEVGITQQAMSDRIRRGTERVLREALLQTADHLD